MEGTGREAVLARAFHAVEEALLARRGADAASRVKAVEEALAAELEGLPGSRERQAVLDALEGYFPVRTTPVEEDLARLKAALDAEKARVAELESKVKRLEEEAASGGSRDIRAILEKLIAKARPGSLKDWQPGAADGKKLEVVVDRLSGFVQSAIGWANYCRERWDLDHLPEFEKLPDLIASRLGDPVPALSEAMKKEVEKLKAFLRALFFADLDFTLKWVEETQRRFAPESFPGHWSEYCKFMKDYRFHADLMQGLKNFIEATRIKNLEEYLQLNARKGAGP